MWLCLQQTDFLINVRLNLLRSVSWLFVRGGLIQLSGMGRRKCGRTASLFTLSRPLFRQRKSSSFRRSLYFALAVHILDSPKVLSKPPFMTRRVLLCKELCHYQWLGVCCGREWACPNGVILSTRSIFLIPHAEYVVFVHICPMSFVDMYLTREVLWSCRSSTSQI